MPNETEFRVYMHTPKQAMAHERRVHNVRDGVEIGWIPYTILVYSGCGSLNHSAFHTAREFRAWLNSRRLTVRLARNGKGNRWGSLYKEG